MASNRHPENIITTVLLRLQAKRDTGRLLHSVNAADSQVSKAATAVQTTDGSIIKKAFIAERQHSWQAHLERIRPFLVHGEGVWWEQDDQSYLFRDGPCDLDFHEEGPTLLHYRQTSIKDVVERQNTCWKDILERQVTLPVATLYTYDEEGDFLTTTTFEAEQRIQRASCRWKVLKRQ